MSHKLGNEGANPSKTLVFLGVNIKNPITIEDMEAALRVLRMAVHDVNAFDSQLEFKTLVAKINRQARQRNGKAIRQQIHNQDESVKSLALEARQTQRLPSMPLVLHKPRNCYICKVPYRHLHPNYHLLCEVCAKLNLEKRQQRTNLTGRVALVTGGRIKIGFELVLKFLQDGARVILTTRFPRDAAERFQQQPDFTTWAHRLEIHSLDLRHLASLQAFIQGLLNTEPHLDILINNAAQTISRPLEFYSHLLESEQSTTPSALIRSKMQFLSVPLELTDMQTFFPQGQFDTDGQALDLRHTNSWTQKLHEVPTRDLLEVQVVNFIAPFMLCSQLKPLLERSPFEHRFIVNVSAMEGQFSRTSKGLHHPHTNAAKAALNMLTRTSGADYAKSKIFMTAVDTGWITDENPFPKATKMRNQGFVTPLDAIDAAARIYDPIASALNQNNAPYYGVFLKNYFPYPW